MSVQFLRYVRAKQRTQPPTTPLTLPPSTPPTSPPTSPPILPPPLPPPPLLPLRPSLLLYLPLLPSTLLSLSLLSLLSPPVALAVVAVVLAVVTHDVVVVLAYCPHRLCWLSLPLLPSSLLLVSLPSSSLKRMLDGKIMT